MNIIPFSRTLAAVAALLVAPVSWAGLVAYSQNFEGLSGAGALPPNWSSNQPTS